MHAPFKFLDAYTQQDAAVFFGREKEIDELYHSLSGVKQLLVYGSSGAGKTSLIECGLRNQFSDADWFALTIRKGQNINFSVFSAINDALQHKYLLDKKTQMPKDTHIDFTQAVEMLFAERYQPVYLLFDQFEELLILGTDKEKEEFFTRINRLIRYKVPCRIIFIMREEFIGHLSEFEPLCPSLFQHRYRLEKMSRKNVENVIQSMLDAPEYRQAYQVKDSEQLAQRILSKLPDERREIELAHVQVFLSELWDKANGTNPQTAIPVLHEGLIHENDNLEGVLDSFLKKQLNDLEKEYEKKIPLEVLATMISERHTKLQLPVTDIEKDLQAKGISLPMPKLTQLLQDFEKRRILRTLKANERTQYELSHDVLAFIVGKNLTEEMQLREKANDIYKVYQEKKGFFSQEDLDYLRPYQSYKPYPSDLEKRIVESEEYISRGKTEQLAKTRKQLQTLGSLLLVALLALGIAGYYYIDAKKNAEKAEAQTQIAQKNAKEARIAQVSDSIARVKADSATAEAYRNAIKAEHNLRQFHQAEYESIKKRISAYRSIGENLAALEQEQILKKYYNEYSQYISQ